MKVETSLITNKKYIINYTSIIFLLVSLIITIIGLIVDNNKNNLLKSAVLDNEKNFISVEKRVLNNKINNSISDLLYVVDNIELTRDSEIFNGSLVENLKAFSNRKKIYDQIRLIDLNGDELIRINYSDLGSYQVGSDKLQNKNNRYYFYEALKLQRGEIAISKFDLNVENNQIEFPYKPTIRLSTPYFNDKNELEGVIVLNFNASNLIKQILDVASTNDSKTFIVNSEGYWLLNTVDNSKEWGFMFDDKLNISFENEFVNEWNHIKLEKDGTYISEKGVFNFSNFLGANGSAKNSDYDNLIIGDEDWYIISYLSNDSINGRLFAKNVTNELLLTISSRYLSYSIILLISFFAGIILTLNKIERNKTEYYSEFDEMTGVYNRRAGFKKLHDFYKDVIKNSSKMSVCFIDINGLKEVNDNLGHEEGDKLITTVIELIKKNIREHDFIARLGGDEFLITFEGIDSEEAEVIWQRIISDFEIINNDEARPYILSASHGIETLTFNTDSYIDSIVNSADEKMYEEKRIIKEKINIIR